MFKTTEVFNQIFKRAAHRAALFLILSGLVMTTILNLGIAAHAKMRASQLLVAPASGGATQTIQIEVADSEQEKALGLMFRTKLADGEGMLFFYGPEREITMWMRNTYIPLDMLFIRADGVIHRIEAKAEPLSDNVIASNGPVAAVVEMAGGAAGRLGIKAGDKVRHEVFKAAAAPAGAVTPKQ